MTDLTPNDPSQESLLQPSLLRRVPIDAYTPDMDFVCDVVFVSAFVEARVRITTNPTLTREERLDDAAELLWDGLGTEILEPYEVRFEIPGAPLEVVS